MNDGDRLELERNFFQRLLELGERDDMRPFLVDALALIASITDASRGYLEIDPGSGRGEPPFWIAHGFTDVEIDAVRRDISSGIIGSSLRTGQTISTASAVQDPRFRDQESVQSLRIESVLCAPVGGGSPIGVLYLQGGNRPFSADAKRYAELFARHLTPLADRLLVREDRHSQVDHTLGWRSKLQVGNIVGTSPALAEVFRQVAVAAPVPVSVLITGESGTGKTAIARAIHESSPRSRGPFVEVNCTSIPESLFESELFGAERGAHSTATQRMEGKVDAARGGTILLDEIGDMPLAVQGKLLMFLQSHRYYRLGSAKPLEADVRVLAATNADLPELVGARKFREDLFYRLNVLELHLPPLRNRRQDIGAVAGHVAARIGEQHGRHIPLSRAAVVALEQNDWPGNVRQLENVVQRGWAVALSEESLAIEPRHILPTPATEPLEEAPETYEAALRAFQASFLRRSLEQASWNVSETARRIGLSRSHLNDLIKAHGLSRKQST